MTSDLVTTITFDTFDYLATIGCACVKFQRKKSPLFENYILFFQEMISSTTGRMMQNAARLMPVRVPISVAVASICQNSLSPTNNSSHQVVRCFHASTAASAKKGKGSKNDNDDSPIVMPDMKNMDVQMEKKISRLTDEFAKLRTGQPNTEIFRTVMVESGGARVSVADSGQLTVKSPTKMSISVFDPSLITAVAEAIRECGMGLTPVIEGSSVVMSIPKPSKESKEALVKTARIIADKVSFHFILFSTIQYNFHGYDCILTLYVSLYPR